MYLGILCHMVPLLGTPLPPACSSGNMSITYKQAQHLEVDAADGTTLDFSRLEIQPDESLTISLPSEDSVVYLRAKRGNSNINGTLESNGHLLLYSPEGLTIGQKGKIIAHSFVGTTLAIAPQQYFAFPLNELTPTGENQALILHLGSIETTHNSESSNRLIRHEVIVYPYDAAITKPRLISSLEEHNFYPELLTKYQINKSALIE